MDPENGPEIEKPPTIEACPHCGGTSGYYDKNTQSYQQNYNWQGTPVYSSEPTHIRGGERKFCTDCDRDITKKLTISP